MSWYALYPAGSHSNRHEGCHGIAMLMEYVTDCDLCLEAYNGVLSNVSRTEYVLYYRQLKDLLCCDLTHALKRMWESWTAAATSLGASAAH